ncbi:MAG: bifunctional riboflavin kinase/FAD synthetase [Bacteroidales bacterium]|jgi:riboflavin kinase/FMN adenylyltransferase|nr:bifunctional riboflavin kinase/FAD synthetase [Bacteroidales bacterium]
MKIHYSISAFTARNPVITIGMFDGVHLGHKKLLSQVCDEAQKINGESVVLSFWPHPQMLFNADASCNILTTIEEKCSHLERYGIDHCIILPFTKEFSQISPEQYIHDVLYEGIGAKTIIIGYDHRFGHKGFGNFLLLKQFEEEYGFTVQEIAAYDVENITVSSTIIREALFSGDVDRAQQYLNYFYSVKGTVVHGKKIGRTLGVPTANILPESEYKIIPASGIYIVQVIYNNHILRGVANIGFNPTVDANNKTRSLEVFIFNFSQEIYNEELRVVFLRKVRDEEKFMSLTELQKAIQNDIQIAEEYFISNNNPINY